MAFFKTPTKFPPLTLLAFVALISLTAVKQTEGFVCPGVEELGFCWCGDKGDGLHPEIDCTGTATTQETIDRTFVRLRELNGDTMETERFLFTLQRTIIFDLDLTSLLGLQFASLVINFNPILSAMHVGTEDAETASKLITAEEVVLAANLLSDEGLESAFKYFAPNVRILDLKRNQIRGSYTPPESSPVEFLPHLSAFKDLERLDLSSNVIANLSGGQFKAFKNLQLLNLNGNGLKELGARAFVLDEPDDDSNVLLVSMRNNNLTDAGIDSTFAATNRPTRLNMDLNHFDFIGEASFKTFLAADPTNDIFFEFNPFLCDSRMSWVRAKNQNLQSRLFHLDCSNDIGQDAFHTGLISSSMSLSGSRNLLFLLASFVIAKLLLH